jgi:hypothetical protein
MNRHAAISIAIIAGACASDEPQLGSTSQATVASCSIILCGDNAATAGDGIWFDEIDLFGSPNYAGVSLIGATVGGRPVRVNIEHDVLSAVDIADPRISYEHAALVPSDSGPGLEIEFRYDRDGTSERIDLGVFGVDEDNVHYLAGDRTQIIPAYYLLARRWSVSPEFDIEICNDTTVGTDPTWAGTGHYAIMYRGDKYDPHAKAVLRNDPTKGWSFIACNRSAASKMHMWRHTYAGAFDRSNNETYPTTELQRTALLKAITADYCGRGRPDFTETGTPLAFATALDPTAFPFPYTSTQSFEAVWNSDGAVCLHKPRLLDRAPLIAATCTIPACTPDNFVPGWEASNHVITATPTLP